MCRWGRRYCAVTPTTLMYCKRERDLEKDKKIYIRGCALKMSDKFDFCFELWRQDLNKCGVLYFQAENEEELQR
jgi:hypothetical protein